MQLFKLQTQFQISSQRGEKLARHTLSGAQVPALDLGDMDESEIRFVSLSMMGLAVVDRDSFRLCIAFSTELERDVRAASG